jgi:hypothetical protein
MTIVVLSCAIALQVVGQAPQSNDTGPSQWSEVLQVALLIVTAITGGFIAWQAWETKRAAKAAADSVEAINRQASIMERQTKAAQQAAEAAAQNIQILISKERARLQMEVGSHEIATVYDPLLEHKVEFRLRCYGTTQATIVETRAWGQINDSREWHRGESYGPLLIPSVLNPPEGAEGSFLLSYGGALSSPIDVGEMITAGKLFAHFYGYIRYEDIFGGQWKYPFRYAWIIGQYGHGQWLGSTEARQNLEIEDRS